jgi:hypothetical protein
MKRLFVVVPVFASLVLAASLVQAQTDPGEMIHKPYLVNTPVESRSISYENRTGEKGAGGKAASKIGPGRKGSPAVNIEAGTTFELCDIAGPGAIRHIWMTTRGDPVNLRSLVIRAYWEGQEHPSIESPLGDFMGIGHGKVVGYQSAVHSVGERAGMNIWLPMPFSKRARMTITNEGEKQTVLFYQIDYTINDQFPDGFGRLHVLFRRENPTTLKKDFELLPLRKGRGRFVGSIIGIHSLSANWWGEGEIKVYFDGDTEFPTICGTGSEDYVGLSWGIQQTPFLYNGCSLDQDGFVCMYRWHLPDPIYWKKDCRVTIQQIGWRGGLYERQDDWSCATFWYEPVPSEKLPPLPGVKERTDGVAPPPKPNES